MDIRIFREMFITNYNPLDVQNSRSPLLQVIWPDPGSADADQVGPCLT